MKVTRIFKQICASALATTLVFTGIPLPFSLGSMVAEVEAKEFENFYYDMKEDGTVIITGMVDDNVSDVVIPSTIDGMRVTEIGNSAFESYDCIKEITIPNTVEIIDDFAFFECGGLEKLSIPDSVTSIGQDAFFGCYSLECIEVDSNNSYYDSRDNCNAIIETKTNTLLKGCDYTVIPNSVISIYDYAFAMCEKITSLTIPNSITNIGNYAFGACINLERITIPASVTSIGLAVFYSCSQLSSIVVDANNQFYDSRNDCNAIIETKTNVLIQGCNNTTSIPSTVKSIASRAFNGCETLNEVVIPESVTSIGDVAFGSCYALTKIVIPKSVTSIGDFAFLGCCDLTIQGEVGSVAEAYAKENNINFEVICEEPPAKVTLSSVANSASGITVKWNKVEGADYYRVYRKTGVGSWTKMTDTKDGTVTSYTDTTATSGTTYTYTVKAFKKKVGGAYDKTGLTICRLSQPKLTSSVNDASGVTVKWGKVTGATGYYVYRKSGSGSWSKIGTIKSNGTVSYADKTAKSGTTYTYTVRAYKGSSLSSYDKTGVSACRLSQPALSSISNASSGITVKWGKVTGATGYYVYRKSGSGSWSKIGTIKSNGTVSYTDKTAKSGTTYTYTVRAYKGSYLSSYDKTGKSMKRLSQPALPKLTKVSNGIKITLTKVTGASGYYVYRKEGSGSWKRIASTTSLSVTDKTAVKGHTYVYTVRAYGKVGSTTVLSSYNSTGSKITR